MLKRKTVNAILIGSLSFGPLVACESLPGNSKQQGAVIGGVGGAVAGGAIARHNRLLGALIGGALGAGGGYLIGAQVDKTHSSHRDEAIDASRRAERNPARPEDVRNSDTADLNRDGYVTMDEVVAMRDAGLSDEDMIRRLRATGQVFELTDEQTSYLRDHRVDRRVIDAMLDMNRSADTRY